MDFYGCKSISYIIYHILYLIPYHILSFIIIFFLILLLAPPPATLKEILKGKIPFSLNTLEAAKQFNMNYINEILNSEELDELVKHKYDIDYLIKDLIRLNNGVWLNDEIININMLRIKEKVIVNKDIHIFNSWFIGKLYRDNGNVYAYSNVNRLS